MADVSTIDHPERNPVAGESTAQTCALPAHRVEAERDHAILERDLGERFRLLIEHAPAALAMLDRDMRYLAVSGRWFADYGLSTGVIGLSHYDVFPEIGESLRSVHARALGGEVVRADEDRFVRRDGRVQWLRWEVMPWRHSDGSVGGIVIFSEDITGQKHLHEALRQSDARHRQLARELDLIFRANLDLLCVIDSDGRFRRLNPGWERTLGYPLSALVGTHYLEWVHPEDALSTEKAFTSLSHQASMADFTNRCRCSDGSYRWIEWRSTLQGDTVYGSARDITERKQAEAILKASEEKFQKIFESAPVLIALLSLETGKYLDVNEAFCQVAGLARDDLLGKSAVQLGQVAAKDYRDILSVLQTQGRIHGYPLTVHPREGSSRHCLLSGEILTLDRRPTVLSILLDVTERQHAERALQSSVERFQQISEAAEDWIWEVDAQGLYTYASPIVERLLGYKPEELVGKRHYYDLWPEPTRQVLQPLAENAFGRLAEFRNLANLCRHKSGALVSVETTALPILAASGELLGYRGIDRNVTEREAAQRAIRESEARFRGLFEHLPVAVWEEDLSRVAERFAAFRSQGVTDLRAYLEEHPAELRDLVSRVRILEVNEASLKLFGAASRECLVRDLGVYFTESSLALFRDELVALFEGETTFDCEAPHLDLKGNTLFLQIRFSILPDHARDLSRILVSFTDLTARKAAEAERQRLEREVNHLQRMESLGRLASGVSHDINNVLGAIMAIGSLLRTRHHDNPTTLNDAELLIESAVRGRDLVRGLQTFGRKELESAVELDLNDLATREAALLERTTLKRVSIVLELTPNLPRILGEASGIQNALMNLCLNAIDAMSANGTLTLITRNLGEGFVEMAVQDDGEGMTAEVRARALEPFFTTKPAGKGTGLGLSQVYGTVKAHGGTLDILSEPGRGTRVSIVFPTVSPPSNDGPIPSMHPARAGRPLEILLVDDEELMRGTVRDLLRVLGHNPQAAHDGAEALRRVEAGLEVDLVVLDINMPTMDGVETLVRLQALQPELPVLLATGFVDDRIPPILARSKRVRLIKKPFKMTELAHALAEWM